MLDIHELRVGDVVSCFSREASSLEEGAVYQVTKVFKSVSGVVIAAAFAGDSNVSGWATPKFESVEDLTPIERIIYGIK